MRLLNNYEMVDDKANNLYGEILSLLFADVAVVSYAVIGLQNQLSSS